MSNVVYSFSQDDGICNGKLHDGTVFLFDAALFPRIDGIKFYRSRKDTESHKTYIVDRNGKKVHMYLLGETPGFEVDHINLDTLDNRMCNLRICTHQQNQCNQPLQRNNTSGVSGVSYYPPRHKYRARIKIGQHDIHLGYYCSFIEAVQARNVGMECMFGEYGRYNDAPAAPEWIRKPVVDKCKCFAELSVCRAFLLSHGGAA